MADLDVGPLLVTVRADLSSLQQEVKRMEGTFNAGFNNIKSSALNVGKELAASLGFGLSIGAVVAFGKSIVNLAGHLDDLAKQTGISGQTLSGITSVLEQNGTSVDQFAVGIFNLQKNL